MDIQFDDLPSKGEQGGRCLATRDGWYCTIDAWHDGPHVARDRRGAVVAIFDDSSLFDRYTAGWEYERSAYGVRHCGSRSRVGYTCTRAEGHEGVHTAHGVSNGIPLAAWTDDEQAASPADAAVPRWRLTLRNLTDSDLNAVTMMLPFGIVAELTREGDA